MLRSILVTVSRWWASFLLRKRHLFLDHLGRAESWAHARLVLEFTSLTAYSTSGSLAGASGFLLAWHQPLLCCRGVGTGTEVSLRAAPLGPVNLGRNPCQFSSPPLLTRERL